VTARLRRQPREQTRQALVDAAARVIARRGLHAASVEAITDEAGLSTGALYSNFKGKEDLFLRLYEDRILRRAAEFRAVIGADGVAHAASSAAAAVAQALRDERDWFLLYFEFALHAARDADFARRFEAVRDAGLEELANGLSAAFTRFGVEAPSSPAVVARAVRAVVYGLALEAVVDDSAVSEATIHDSLRLVLLGAWADGGSNDSR
jgi:AcrR family transcriptional regulator